MENSTNYWPRENEKSSLSRRMRKYTDKNLTGRFLTNVGNSMSKWPLVGECVSKAGESSPVQKPFPSRTVVHN